MKRISFFLFISLTISVSGCLNSSNKKNLFNDKNTTSARPVNNKDTRIPKHVADASTVLARKEVPVLCYHQIRDWTASDSRSSRDYIIPLEVFKSHLKMLADSGYHTILPDQLYDYLAYGTPLPKKPIMLTYDDTDDGQFTIAAPEMKKYGFKGVFFIMTVSVNRPRYMTSQQLMQLTHDGNVIESHTWDHHSVKGYKTEQDWLTQIEKPKKRIEEITGTTSKDFAYPFGLWNRAAIPELRKRGVRSAYILSTKRDPDDPLYTIRRIIASGYWNAGTLQKSIIQLFHLV